jgi:ElaB/YqjD/DUF883 family membrane-anchored ribosome-binding protein
MRAPTMLEQATQVFGHTREYANERAEQVKSFVHEKPFLTTFLGLGAGFVLGMLLFPKVPKVMVEIRTKGKAE